MKNPLPALYAGLLCSGAAALLYESAWTRMLHRLFGVSDLAIATVLACFFLGLGLGSAAGGQLARRVRRPVLVYAILEAIVAVYALASLWIVPALQGVYAGVGPDASFGALTAMRLALAAIALLPPTLAMGATLPILASIARGHEGWAREVTGLYVANTLGGVVGAALAGFWLIPHLGTRASIGIAAALGVAAGVIVLAGLRAVSPEARVAPEAKPPSSGPRPSLALATTLTALSGATALAGEVVWTRVLRIIVHGTTAAFAAMLVNYLLGIAIGAVLARRIARRVPAARAFGALQLASVAAFALAMVMVPHVPRIIPLLRNQLDIIPHESWVLLLVSGLVLFPLALITGTGLPLTWAMAEERSGDAGAASGRLLAANTIGGLVGALGAGFLLVPAIGVEASLLAIAAVSAISAAIALRASAGDDTFARVAAATGPLVLIVAIVLARPTLSLPYLLSAGTFPLEAMIEGPTDRWREPIVFLREGRNTTVTVRRSGRGLALFNDGRPESGFSVGEPGFGAELAVLGALPGLFAEEREAALVIGLGAGHTSAIALASEFDRVTVVELEEAVVDASRLMYEARSLPFPLDDPRATLVVDDARNRILLAPDDSLDAVVSQPSHPWLAGSSALYTEELFSDVRRALRPGGVLALWVNLFRMDVRNLRSILATLASAFPNVLGFVVEESSLVLVASESPLDWDRAARRLDEVDGLRRYLAPDGLDTVARLGSRLELDAAALDVATAGMPHIVDDRPALEFELARLRNSTQLRLADIDATFAQIPWIGEGTRVPDATALERMLAERIDHALARPTALDRVARSLDGSSLPPSALATTRGRLAAARGDVRGALARFAEAATPEAASLEDATRADEELWRALLHRAATREVIPTSTAPIVDAAFALDEPAALAAALGIAARVGGGEDAERVDALRRYARGGCAELLSDASVERATRASAPLAFVAARCALVGGDPAGARRFEEHAWRRRTVRANEWTRIGEAALVGGNGGLALAALQRALRTYPSSSRAAVALARLHARDHRPEIAHRVLLDAWAATEGLDESRARIAAAAVELGIDLGAEADAAARESSSASTAPRTAPPPPE